MNIRFWDSFGRKGRALRVMGAFAIAIIAALCAGLTWRLLDRDPEVVAADVESSPALIAKGEYLARAADCVACHSAPGRAPFSGGVAFRLPFGTIYSTNITPDRETGIGSWSDNDFVRALHRGIAKDGTYLYAAFPYTSYTAMRREDAVPIKAYLFSLPAVHAPPRANSLSFPFNQRWSMAIWNLLFLKDRRFRPDPSLNDRENRGAYLASALGHCGECHTPRNMAFALDNSKKFAGAIVEGWRAYNISSDQRFGVGGWSDNALAEYLSSGHAANRGSAGGPMGEAVADSLQYLASGDVDALVAYLKRISPQLGQRGSEISLSSPAMAVSSPWGPGIEEDADGLGRRIFEGACASCHQWNGNGQQTSYAALAGSQTVNDPTGTNLIQILLTGADLASGKVRAYMPPFGKAYSAEELAAVSNYVIAHFGGKPGLVTAEMVRQRKAN